MRGSPWLLAFDASAPRTAVAVGRVDEGRLVAFDEDEAIASHASATLVPRIQATLGRAGIVIGDLGAVAVGCGPGTFTGTRVAVATAMGLALGLGTPAVPFSSLTALAASDPATGRVLALLDARRGEVYGAVVRLGEGDAELLEESTARCCPLGALLHGLDLNDLRVFGPGVTPHADALVQALARTATPAPGPTGRGAWRAALAAWRSARAVDAEQLRVDYLRASYAEIGVHPAKRPLHHSPYL